MRAIGHAIALSVVLVGIGACASTRPGPPAPAPPRPAPTVAIDLVACADPPVHTYCRGIDGATGRLDKVPGTITFDRSGYAYVDRIPADLGQTELVIDAPGYAHFDSGPLQLAELVAVNAAGGHNAFQPTKLPPPHVDPATVSRETLRAFRGSLFTVVADCGLPMFLPNGQRVPVVPFAPLWATPEQRQCSYDLWKARGYTHGVKGPGLDPGYHNQTPSVDFRTDGGAAFLDQLEAEWDQGFVPIAVVVPDHLGPEQGWAEHVWTVDELHTLEPIYRSERFQRLARVVMLCWECQGSQYGWRNETYVAYLSWLRDVFPNAIRVLHTIADIEAPVGDGDETDTAHCHGLPPSRCLSNGQAWANITPLFHVWFHQSSALFEPSHVADNGQTDSENWLRLWDRTNPASFVNRFGRGFAGWPTTSANGGPLIALPGEFLSFPTWWRNASEEDARTWGDRAIDVGAPGSMDGCRRCGR